MAEIYLDCGEWEETKKRVINGNALQSRTLSSAVRMEREFRPALLALELEGCGLAKLAPEAGRDASSLSSAARRIAERARRDKDLAIKIDKLRGPHGPSYCRQRVEKSKAD